MTLPTPTDDWLTKTEYDVDWTAEGGIGTIVDQHGNTVYGNPDGLDDDLKYTTGSYFNSGNVGVSGKMTMGMWIKIPVGFSGGTGHPFAQRSTTRFTLMVNINPVSGILQTWKGESNTNYLRVDCTGDLRDGKWHHVVIVWDKSEALDVDKIKHYVDGVNCSSSTASAGAASSDWPGTFNAQTRIFAQLDPATGFKTFEATRHKTWIGSAPNQTEVDEEFDAECAAAVVPTKTFFSADLSDEGEWTRIGTPAFVDGQIGPVGAALDSDGTDDQIHQSEVIVDSSATEHTVAIWIKTTASIGVFIAQFRANPTDFGTFALNLGGSGGGKVTCRWDGPNEGNRVITQGATAINDGEWHLVTSVLRSPTDADIYIDGVEDTYATENQVTGSGFTSTVNGSVNLNIGNYDPAGTSDSFYDGLSHRPAIWDGLGISSCQVLKYYNEEFSLIGSGFNTPPTGSYNSVVQRA